MLPYPVLVVCTAILYTCIILISQVCVRGVSIFRYPGVQSVMDEAEVSHFSIPLSLIECMHV